MNQNQIEHGDAQGGSVKAKAEWRSPELRVMDVRQTEIGLIDPAPEGTFGLS